MSESSSEMAWPPAYQVKKHRRARSVKFRAVRPHGLQVTVPYRYNVSQLPQLLEEHKEWIVKHLAALKLHLIDELPLTIPIAMTDTCWQVCYVPMNAKVTIQERFQLKEIACIGEVEDKAACKKKLVQWLKKHAEKQLVPLLNALSERMQLPYHKVTIRDQRTLWGSCTRDKSINLSYKLIFLSHELASHVLIHELAHTKHLNHSKRFWDLVAAYDPQWREHKHALRHAQHHMPTWLI